MILYECLSGIQTISRHQIFDGVEVILLRGIRSPVEFRALRRLVVVTLGRLGCAQDCDHVTRIIGRIRNDFEDEL